MLILLIMIGNLNFRKLKYVLSCTRQYNNALIICQMNYLYIPEIDNYLYNIVIHPFYADIKDIY